MNVSQVSTSKPIPSSSSSLKLKFSGCFSKYFLFVMYFMFSPSLLVLRLLADQVLVAQMIAWKAKTRMRHLFIIFIKKLTLNGAALAFLYSYGREV